MDFSTVSLKVPPIAQRWVIESVRVRIRVGARV